MSEKAPQTEAAAEVKNGETSVFAEVAEVTSNFPSVDPNFRERKRKSLATSANGSGSPLSKRERVGGEGELKPSPLLSSLHSTPTPKSQPGNLASYHGAISRWCALTGNTPDATGQDDKLAAELRAFEDHLASLAAEKRRLETLQF